MSSYLSDNDIGDLITKIKAGDNAAWESVCENFARYIHERAWNRLRKFTVPQEKRKDMEEDLYMAGWQGFVSAIKGFDPEKGRFLTYATYYIDGEISKELDILLNPLGLTERPKYKDHQKSETSVSRISLDESAEYEADITQTDEQGVEDAVFDFSDAPNRGKYNAERRTLQLLEVLRMVTDEAHTVSKDKLVGLLRLYRMAKYDNGAPTESPTTIATTLESILEELNPPEYSGDNDDEYRLKYKGYKEDRLKKKKTKTGTGKAADITGFYYVHIFDDEQMDKLIQLISFSDMISEAEKTALIGKLIATASEYYKTPFWDGTKLKFNPRAIHTRLSGADEADGIRLSQNLKVIQDAVNNMAQIRFYFNRYTAEQGMTPSSEYLHELSPYHLVCYHDNYYCIGLKKDDKRIWHYRIDLMSDVEIVRDETGEPVPIEVSAFAGLPIANAAWNPGEYMAEHLNMAYDEPQDIRIRIRSTDYTIIHDWFGEHYEKVDEVIGLDGEMRYDIVKVRTSPSMIVHWALQYGSRVEIMDEEIREKIREEMKRIQKIYEKARP